MAKIVTVLSRYIKSGSGVALAEELSKLGLRSGSATPASSRKTKDDRVIINWGCSTAPANFRQRSVTWSNTAQAVRNCADKISTFVELAKAGIPCVEAAYREGKALAEEWLKQDGKIVVRNVINGHSGQGIEIVRKGTAIPDAPLYTRYFRKNAEYRVHVAFGKVILIQQKKRQNDREQSDVEALVRTHANGWIFACNDLACDDRNYRDSLCGIATRSAAAVGANHCAVDILVSHSDGNLMRVVEVNSAPALKADSTLSAYAEAFKEWIDSL